MGTHRRCIAGPARKVTASYRPLDISRQPAKIETPTTAEALEERERLAAKERKGRPGQPRSAKFAQQTEKGKSRAKVAKAARASALAPVKMNPVQTLHRVLPRPPEPAALRPRAPPCYKGSGPSQRIERRLEPNQPHDTRSGVVWTVESHRTNPHPSNAPSVRLARRGGPPVASRALRSGGWPARVRPASARRSTGPAKLLLLVFQLIPRLRLPLARQSLRLGDLLGKHVFFHKVAHHFPIGSDGADVVCVREVVPHVC